VKEKYVSKDTIEKLKILNKLKNKVSKMSKKEAQ